MPHNIQAGTAIDILDGGLEHRQPFPVHLNAARGLAGGFGEGSGRVFEMLDSLHAYAAQTNPRHR